jgi:hypothetical protein
MQYNGDSSLCLRRKAWSRGLWLGLSVMLVAAMAGCSGNAPTAPAVPASTATAVGGTFAIYLTDPEVRPEQLVVVSHLELAAEPIISSDDIVSYVWATHEITLTPVGVERLTALQVPTSGKSFVVCVDRAPIYAGAFWAAYSSQSFAGVVIDPILVTLARPVIQIVLGYPGPDFFRGEDPRPDPGIRAALEAAGKLR